MSVLIFASLQDRIIKDTRRALLRRYPFEQQMGINRRALRLDVSLPVA